MTTQPTTEGRGDGTPIPMVLLCPKCGAKHIDDGEWATRPHRTHLCDKCQHEWRPSPLPTVGVTYEEWIARRDTRAATGSEAGEEEDRRLSLDAIDEAIDYCMRKGGQSLAIRLRDARETFASPPLHDAGVSQGGLDNGYLNAAVYLQEQAMIHLKQSKEWPENKVDAVNAMALALQYAAAIRKMGGLPPITSPEAIAAMKGRGG